ncbi:cobalt transporter CbiM [Methyloversatilis universalis]|uniref:cobalt transporter CbiM n=1 Tax=Methyloversatilis universalis TaxID=378211 RepID=UPI00036A4CD6|nr:cobalt transporter CbiM [Methyloversatilis universalis]
MHIAEGVLNWPVLAGGAAITAVLTGVGLKRLDDDRLPLAGMMAALFFVASLIHVPVGVGSVHLVLNGLCGIMLGWAAYPVILVSLLLQALLFGFGGLTSLGVNAVVMGLPALLCGLLFAPPAGLQPRAALMRGGLAGAVAIAGGVLLMTLALYLSGGRAFMPLMTGVLVAHLPVAVIEALVTGIVLSTLIRMRPALLAAQA